MPSLPPPPGSPTDVHARCALVLAPHFDDEVLGCGGLLLRLLEDGASVHVLFLSDGGAAGAAEESAETPADYAARRREEAKRAAEILGLTSIRELDLPDGALEQHLDELASALGDTIADLEPDLVLVPAPSERSADHRAAFAALHRRLAAVRPGDPLEEAAQRLRVLLYEVNHPLYPDVLVAVEDQLETLGRAMGCYASQLERHDYWQAGLGRRRFRAHTLPAGTGAVEAYRQLAASDFQTRGPAALLRHLGVATPGEEITEGPLVSVIVRTKDRPELLAEALASLASSRYRRLEVLVVNDGGSVPEPPSDFPFELRVLDLQPGRGRAGAANAGLEAARGDYVAFLDDDDVVEPEHYAVLVGLASAAGVRVAYTDAAVVVHELDAAEGWRESERRLPYSRDFDPDLLLLDNYIPFHTLLIERRLALEAGELDSELPFFEDWDYLIRLAALAPFHHLARVTCEYRQFRGGGHHVLGDRPRQRADFLDMKARVLGRHLERLEPARLARVVDLLRAETVAAEERARSLAEESEEQEAAFHRLRGTLRASEDRRRQLEALEERARYELEGERAQRRGLERQKADLERQIAELHAYQESQGAELRGAYAEIGRLTELVRSMESTRAWRWHQRLQKWKP